MVLMPHQYSEAELETTAGAPGIVMGGRYMPPPADKDGKLWVRTSALIQASPHALYMLWRDTEKAPQWQEQIVSAEALDANTIQWTMVKGKDEDKLVRWTTEILADEPGRRIAWQSAGGDLDEAGEVVFHPSPGKRGTIVTVLQEFRMSKLKDAWQTLMDRSPKQAIIENLRHFKALAETGEIPRTAGQPHGPRGAIGDLKKSAYGEKTPVPPGQVNGLS